MIDGSLFAGIGGLDLAVGRVFGSATAWQLDLTGHEVRRRHWPRARQVVADIRRVDPSTLAPVDVLGGFPCQDLSVAGKGEGLDGEKSGLYRELVRFVRVLEPQHVVIENVPRLLKYRERLEADFADLVFVLATKGQEGHRLIDAKKAGAGDHWPTPTAINPNESEGLDSWRARSARLVAEGSRPLSPPLGVTVRMWPTPSGMNGGQTRRGGDRGGELLLGGAVVEASERPWATPTKQNTRSGSVSQEYLDRNARPLGEQVFQVSGGSLNPDWVETLHGFPVGWTRPLVAGDLFGRMGSLMPRALELLQAPRWPRGRPPKDHVGPWPGHAWEPPRTVKSGGPERRCRLGWLGNAVCPLQAIIALQLARAS